MPSSWYVKNLNLNYKFCLLLFCFMIMIGMCDSIPELDMLGLPCGDGFTVSVRGDILELESVARRFEEERDVVNLVKEQSVIANDMILLSKMYPVIEGDSYVPYCEIGMESRKEWNRTDEKIFDTCKPESISLINHVRLNFHLCLSILFNPKQTALNFRTKIPFNG